MNSQRILKYLLEKRNVDLSVYDESFLKNVVDRRLEILSIADINEYMKLIFRKEDEINCILESITVSYSEFFRNSLTFAVLEKIILPRYFSENKQKELIIWSVACAGGQEAYSLSILLNELNDRLGRDIKYRIFASDISKAQIKKAITGFYKIHELGNINIYTLNKYFQKYEDGYFVKDSIKKNIDFSVLDLFDKKITCPANSLFSDFDIIICANILFYINKAKRAKLIERLSNSLSKSGLIITGEVEREIIQQHKFIEIVPNSAIFKRKE
ncbi:MAG: hypothetical protein PHH37_01985 [Paludibacter sp.]|nr:hypothetical protein [Paludibacter sp.]